MTRPGPKLAGSRRTASRGCHRRRARRHRNDSRHVDAEPTRFAWGRGAVSLTTRAQKGGLHMLRCVKAWHVVGIAALAMTVVESGSLSAQSFVASPGQKQDIDLDSGDGSLSVWQHKDLRSLSAMKATIKVVRLGKDATFDPYFTVRVTAGGAFYGLRLQT